MTLQEAKDEVAKKLKFESWAEYMRHQYHTYDSQVIDERYSDMVSEFYAKSHSTELLERLEKEIKDRMNYLGNDENTDVGDEEAYFGTKECQSILSLLSTIKPK